MSIHVQMGPMGTPGNMGWQPQIYQPQAMYPPQPQQQPMYSSNPPRPTYGPPVAAPQSPNQPLEVFFQSPTPSQSPPYNSNMAQVYPMPSPSAPLIQQPPVVQQQQQQQMHQQPPPQQPGYFRPPESQPLVTAPQVHPQPVIIHPPVVEPQHHQRGRPRIAPAWSRIPKSTRPLDDTVIVPEIKLMAKMRALEELAPDSPAVQRLISTFSLLVDLFKLSMASMLSVFVPQLCPGNQLLQGGPDNCTNILIPHDCTFTENFHCLSPFNKFVLTWNFLCLGILGFHYYLVYKRENWMIENLQESLTKGRLNIREVLSEYPTLEIKLHRLNEWVFNTSVVAILMQLVNIIASGYLTLNIYGNGYKSFTTFFTNMLLISIVLYNCVSAAFLGLRHELAYSCVTFEPVSYNAMRARNIKGQ